MYLIGNKKIPRDYPCESIHSVYMPSLRYDLISGAHPLRSGKSGYLIVKMSPLTISETIYSSYPNFKVSSDL